MKILMTVLMFVFVTSNSFAETRYDAKLKSYVKKRLYERVADDSDTTSAQAQINNLARVKMKIDESSLRCMGYPSPNGNAKAIGVCLIAAGDQGSGGDHLKITFAIMISEDIEHPEASRLWDVSIQQYLYF